MHLEFHKKRSRCSLSCIEKLKKLLLPIADAIGWDEMQRWRSVAVLICSFLMQSNPATIMFLLVYLKLKQMLAFLHANISLNILPSFLFVNCFWKINVICLVFNKKDKQAACNSDCFWSDIQIANFTHYRGSNILGFKIKLIE